MKLGKLSVLSAAALLAGGMSFAVAQSNMAPAGSSGASAAQGKCWDSASNQIKDKANTPGATSASGEKKPGDLTTGSSPSGSGSKASGAVTARPAGLPNC